MKVAQQREVMYTWIVIPHSIHLLDNTHGCLTDDFE